MPKMENFNWKSTIETNILMLRSVGLWPKSGNYSLNFYTLYAIISTIFIMGSHNFFQTTNMFFVYDNLEALTGTIFTTMIDLLGSLKMYCLARNMGNVKNLMATLESALFQPRNLEQIDLVQPRLTVWTKMYAVYWLMVGTTVLGWAVFPVVENTVKDGKLPFAAWYPYNSTVSPNYEITYCYQLVCLGFFTVSNINHDTLVFALMMFIATQCDILCDDLRNLEHSSFNKNLIICVKHHKEILRFAQNSNKFFNVIILGQFFTSVMVLTLTMFQLSLVDPFSSASFTHLFYITALTSQIFLYSWFGNEVTIQSSQIPYSAFESDWTGIPLEAKKNLIIFIIRTQRPIKMSAINLFSLSLATFTTILRTSWSYFAVLRRVNAPE